MEESAREIERQSGNQDIKIARLRTLKAPTKLNPAARYNSFVIQTHDPTTANKWIKSGVYYNCRLYPVEQHTP